MAGKYRRKKLLLPVIALILIAATGTGIWLATRGGGEPVNVYSFQYVGMTEFWGDAQESYGPVSTDKIQTEFLSNTQTITEVAVKVGDAVKKGDVLFTFDTTLDGLSLERKRLEVEKVKAQIKAAEERLAEVRNLQPYIPAGEKVPEEEDLGEQLKDHLYKISENVVYDGSKPERALICWLKDDTAVSDAILQMLYKTSLNYREENAQKQDQEEKEESSASDIPEGASENPPEGTSSETKGSLHITYSFTGKATDRDEELVTVGKKGYLITDAISYRGTETYWLTEAKRISDGKILAGEELMIPGYPQKDAAAQQQWEAQWGQGVSLKYTRSVVFAGKYMKDDQLTAFSPEEPLQLKSGEDAVLVIHSQIEQLNKETQLTYSISPEDGIFKASAEGNYLFLTGKPEALTAEPVEYTVTARYTFDDNDDTNRAVEEQFAFSVSVVSQKQKGEFYVVFKVTADNYLQGVPLTWRGYKVTVYEDGNFELLPYDASGFADHTMPPAEDIEIQLPEILPNELYTAEQIQEMQTQLYTTIKEQKAKLKLTETEYGIMQRELGDGNVYAQIDGKVVSLLPEEEARERKQPVIKVSGGGGFYIEGSVSELEKAALKIGQEVTINDWNTGNVYTGQVVSIGDFPTDQDSWNGIGNPTAAYYPYKAFVSEEADLEAGSYVSMSYSAAAAEQGVYLEKPFVRTEKGSSYVYVRGADGSLEKRTVRVGKVLWGSYYEILSGLSEEDYLAFPYGKTVKQGAPTVESDISILYGY